MTIARKFVAQHFDVRSKEVATKMITKIKMAFKNSFYQVDWMDEKAKKGAEEKVFQELITDCFLTARLI